MISQREVVLKLATKMTDEQFIEKSKDLASLLQSRQIAIDKIDEKKAQLKEVKTIQEANIDRYEGEIYDLQLDLNHNHVIDDVECVEIRNYDKATVHYRRKDTNEIVPGRFRKMTQDELSELPLDDTKDGDLAPVDFSPADIDSVKKFLLHLIAKDKLSKEQAENVNIIKGILVDKSALDEDTEKAIEDAEFEVVVENESTKEDQVNDTQEGQTEEKTDADGSVDAGTGECSDAGASEGDSEPVEETPAA